MKKLITGIVASSFVLAAGTAHGQIQSQQSLNPLIIEDGEPIGVHRVARDLDEPWGMAFLPDGRLLVTERGGDLHVIEKDGSVSRPIQGTPTVFAEGQGGLLDVALDPDFEQNRQIYLSYAAPGPGGEAATALGRGRLEGNSIAAWQEIFRQEPWIEGPNHFGGRIEFAPDGTVILTLGERFQFEPAQNPDNHLGAIVRLNADGSVPLDNPFAGDEGCEAAIWSFGHRNIEAAAIDPATGSLWVAEMGPLGGDELNRPEAGRNYGWPTVSWGMNYDGSDIPDPPTRPEFADAVLRWSPVLSPSGMIFYTGSTFADWRGDMFIGSLTQHGLAQVEIDGENASFVRVIPLEVRVRDVVEGPDGHIYFAAGEEGEIRKLAPMR